MGEPDDLVEQIKGMEQRLLSALAAVADDLAELKDLLGVESQDSPAKENVDG